MVRGFKSVMYQIKWKEGSMRNVGSKHGGGSSEYETENGNCVDIEADTDDRNGEQRLLKLNKGS
jgi:hypothetical protein